MEAIVQSHNPPDPFKERPDIGDKLKADLRN
jgi:hypothetical protein